MEIIRTDKQSRLARETQRHMIGLIRIIRLRATSSAPALTLIGWIDVGRLERPGIEKVACSLVSSFALMAFAQVFNDIMDRALDAKAKPDRPIPAGIISVPQAAAMAAALALTSTGLALLTSLATFCYAIFGLTLSILYSTHLKNTVLLGNVTVAFVSCMMLSYGSVAISRPWGRELIGTTMIFLYVLGNELFKTAVDSSEDAQHGLRTIATEHGLRVTAIAIAMVAGAIIAFVTVTGVTAFAPSRYTLATSAIVGLPVVAGAVTANIPRKITVDTLARSRLWWRLAWVPGGLALLLLR